MKFMRYALPCFALLLVGCGGDLFGGGASLGGSGKPSDSINTGVPNRPQLIADNRTAENSTITYSAPVRYTCMGVEQRLQFVDSAGQTIDTVVRLPFNSRIMVTLVIENSNPSQFIQHFEQCNTPFRLLDATQTPLLPDQIYQCDLGTTASLALEPREVQQQRYHIKTPKASGIYHIEYQSNILPLTSDNPKKSETSNCQQQLRLSFEVSDAVSQTTP